MIAQSIDLLRLHEITTAITVPRPTPGPIYTGWVYAGPSVHETKKRISVAIKKIYFVMRVYFDVSWYLHS